jgi:hypothetical protein
MDLRPSAEVLKAKLLLSQALQLTAYGSRSFGAVMQGTNKLKSFTSTIIIKKAQASRTM